VGKSARAVRYWEDHPRGTVTDDILSKERAKLQKRMWALVGLSVKAAEEKMKGQSAMTMLLMGCVAQEMAIEMESVRFDVEGGREIEGPAFEG